jgi:hypothetical protein
MNQINPAAMAAIATLVAMTLSQGHQPPRNSPTGSRSLSFWGRLRYRTYRHPLVTLGIGPPFSGSRGGYSSSISI